MDASRTVSDSGKAQLPLLQRILNRVFRCSHRHLGLPITLRGESFAACLDCGARVAYDLQSFGGHADPSEAGRYLGQLSPGYAHTIESHAC